MSYVAGLLSGGAQEMLPTPNSNHSMPGAGNARFLSSSYRSYVLWSESASCTSTMGLWLRDLAVSMAAWL